jgi:hypothetical protein
MAKSKSTRAAGRTSRVPEEIAPESELAQELRGLETRLNEQFCNLHCAYTGIDSNEAIDSDEDASRARSVVRGVVEALDVLRNDYDRVAVRIAHKGIPARFKGDAVKQGARP